MLTAWARQYRRDMSTANILVSSASLAVGVRLVNSLTGGYIRPHHQRAGFEAALAAAVRPVVVAALRG